MIEKQNENLEKNLLLIYKWEFLYQYAVKALDQDIERFHNLDDKISKFITIITIIISVFVATIPFVFKNHVPPKSIYEYLFMILLFFTFIALCSAWSFLFRALKLTDVPRMPFNDDIISLFKDDKKNTDRILLALSQSCLKAFEKHKEVNKTKVDHLNKAYDDIFWASSFIIADLFFIVLLQFFK